MRDHHTEVEFKMGCGCRGVVLVDRDSSDGEGFTMEAVMLAADSDDIIDLITNGGHGHESGGDAKLTITVREKVGHMKERL